MLFPKKVKHRKWQRLRGHEGRVATRGTKLSFGSYGIKTEESTEISAQQIEAARKAITRYVQKGGKMWIRIFPDKPITTKPPEVGMGKGKGDPHKYVAPVEKGRVLFEVDGITKEQAYQALRKAGAKLPVRVRVVSR
ncbi:MAG: 50S ribosomal protein L16 [Candidatus Niyogibacteria bacterium CG10_big_fil_rev_8_21_14_0_10_42_19]|uniref:Large ribosomal subunit protein uL16 n=1 Tax=Candidatus Niyogibacteria bacterium CG10_big_fil_rev_8_21_14_0_10_42_19 TaxID=1974725 RepID=A0A2H0TFB5_9BACT|nr:MAG: 50S ribosomal protein L16 [Candidatus Niyogibacteria bacterium CG10_big_fil_rev_8_21_14_0_10_42_19]